MQGYCMIFFIRISFLRIFCLCLGLSFGLNCGSLYNAIAEGDSPVAPSTSSSDAPKPKPSRKLRGVIKREKEAEGTKAPNRFDPDIINKSKYELDGQPLEVDP